MNILPTLHTGALVVVCASHAVPHATHEPIAVLAAELALRGPLTILDGGNRFQAYRVAWLLRKQTVDINSAAKRLFIRRAFSCYQMQNLLESTPGLRQPYLILDLLSSFYDEHVSAREAGRLLEACLRQVERLRRQAPVLITLAPPLVVERAFLFELVCAQAERVLVLEEKARPSQQPRLFDC